MFFYLAALLIAFARLVAQITSPAPAVTLAAKTVIAVRLVSTISSHDATTGEKFTFVVAKDVVEDGVVVIPACTLGSGTVTLAGKHGPNGHEGDLHLRFDTISMADGTSIALDPTEHDFAGQNKRMLAFLTDAPSVVGNDVEVKPDAVLAVNVASNATVHPGGTVPACPMPSASPNSTGR